MYNKKRTVHNSSPPTRSIDPIPYTFYTTNSRKPIHKYTPSKHHTLSSLSSISFNNSSSLRGLSTVLCVPYVVFHTPLPTIPFISPISTSVLEMIGTIAFVSENEIGFVPIPLFSSLELNILSAPPTFLAASLYPQSPPTIQNPSTVNTSTTAEEARLRMDSATTTRISKRTITKTTDIINFLTQVSNKHPDIHKQKLMVCMILPHFHAQRQQLCSQQQPGDTSSKLTGSGSILFVSDSSPIVSTTPSIASRLSFLILLVTHPQQYGSVFSTTLQSVTLFFQRSSPTFTKGPFSPSGNQGVGVLLGVR